MYKGEIYNIRENLITTFSYLMVWLLLVAADAPSDDESLCDARPENGQHWGGVTGRKV